MDPYGEEDLEPDEVIDGLGMSEAEEEDPEHEW